MAIRISGDRDHPHLCARRDERVVGVSVQRGALIDDVFDGDWQEHHAIDVSDMERLDAYRDILPLRYIESIGENKISANPKP